MKGLDSIGLLLPILSLFLLNIVAALSLAVPLHQRLHTLPLVLLLGYVSFRSSDWSHSRSAIWGVATLMAVIHYTSLLYVKRWTVRPQKRALDGSSRPIQPLWISMYKIAINPRLVNISRKEIIMPETHFAVRSMTGRSRFSWWRVLRLCICLLLHVCLINPIMLATLILSDLRGKLPVRPSFWYSTRLANSIIPTELISKNELLLRVMITFQSFWTPFMLFEGLHVMFAILFIYVLRLDTPEEWPDLFGSPLEAYTIRRFWSKFWHCIHVECYSAYVHLVAGLMLGPLPTNSINNTAFTVFMMFLFSGLIHALAGWQAGDCAYTSDIWFYVVNFGGIYLETKIMGLARESTDTAIVKPRVAKTTDYHSKDQCGVGPWRRCLGYIWVFGFFSWAVPNMVYPKLICDMKTPISPFFPGKLSGNLGPLT